MSTPEDPLKWILNTLEHGFGIHKGNLSFAVLRSTYVYISGYLDSRTDYCVVYDTGMTPQIFRLTLVNRDSKAFIKTIDFLYLKSTEEFRDALLWLNEVVFRMKRGDRW